MLMCASIKPVFGHTQKSDVAAKITYLTVIRSEEIYAHPGKHPASGWRHTVGNTQGRIHRSVMGGGGGGG